MKCIELDTQELEPKFLMEELQIRELRPKQPQLMQKRVGWLTKFLYFLATFQIVCYYIRNVPSYMRLMPYENGGDHMPFQGRMLMMFLLRWAHGNSGWSALAACSKRFAPWLLPRSIPEAVLQVVVDTACIIITGTIATRIYQASSKERLFTLWVYPMVLVMCVSAYILHTTQNLRFYYDLPSMMFFSVGLYLIYFRRHPALFVALFLVGTINRETTLFLLLFFVLAHLVEQGSVHWRRLRDLRMWGVVVPLGMVWLVWRIWVEWVFRQNPSESAWKFFFNVALVLTPLTWPQLLGAGCYLFPIVLLFRRSIHDPTLRIWLWTIPAWIALMFFYGILVETRIFGELICYLACLTALIAEQAILSALRDAGMVASRQFHLRRRDIIFRSEIDGRISSGVQHVIAFLLGVVRPELILNIFGQALYL